MYRQSSSSVNLVEEDSQTKTGTKEGELEVAFTEFQENMDTTNKWYIDSGTSRHVTGAREHFESVI